MPDRIRLLEATVLMIKNIKSQIVFSKLPVGELLFFLENCGELDCLKFISETKLKLDGGWSFQTAWKQSVQDFSLVSAINNDDAVLISSFSDGLGNSDIEGQVSNCDAYIDLITLKISQLRKKAENSCRLYNSLGVLFGALIAIILY